jgi:hypothetical protein
MRRYTFFLIVVLCMVAASSCSNTPSPDETLRFVFLADSRSDSNGGAPYAAANFINTPVLSAIVTQILALSPRPSFVIFGGDMAYRGHYQDHGVSFYTYPAFKDVMAPLTNAGITVYTTMGNHELYDTSPGEFVLANQTAFQAEFTDNPDNGPAGYERLVYSFTSDGGNAFFAVLDPYYLTANVPDTNLTGNVDDTQLSWLADQVAQTKAAHKFLFIHTPYYYVSDTVPNTTFTNLWSFLDNNEFDFYACGHQHLYSRKNIDSSILPNPQTDPPLTPWKNDVVQLLNGTCGAPHEPGTLSVDPTLWNVNDAADTYFFSVIDIDGDQTTVNSYAGNTGAYSVIDTFTIQKNTSTQTLKF